MSIYKNISLINNHYQQENQLCVPIGRLILVASEDTARGNFYESIEILRIIMLKLSTASFNIIELLKSKLKRRPSIYNKIIVKDVYFRGKFYTNLINGTTLIIGEKYVDKFYFKDIKFFKSLYCSIGTLLRIVIIDHEEYILVRGLKLESIVQNGDDRAVLGAISNQLKDFSGALKPCAVQNDLFSIRAKVEQLYLFYSPNQYFGKADYLEVAVKLENMANRFNQTLCHGDLWRENILEDGKGGLALIDFDKAVYFCSAYDFVYYYLMTNIAPSMKDIYRILDHTAKITRDIQTFFEVGCDNKLGIFDDQEVKLCIYLYSFLKLIARDLRYGKLGESASVLYKVIETESTI